MTQGECCVGYVTRAREVLETMQHHSTSMLDTWGKDSVQVTVLFVKDHFADYRQSMVIKQLKIVFFEKT